MNDNYQKLLKRIEVINEQCLLSCFYVMNRYLPVSGNIGVFSQSDEEYENFTNLRKQLCIESLNPKQKYFELKAPIQIMGNKDIPSVTLTHLYIRKLDVSEYGRYLGDIDFIMPENEYLSFKSAVNQGQYPDAQIYYRVGWDTIQLHRPGAKAIAYVSTLTFAQKVRIKFD